MPIPLAPYPMPSVPSTPPANGKSHQPRTHQGRGTKPARVFWMPKPFSLSSRSNLCMLCCLQCSHGCATSWHGNGSVGLWGLSHLTHVHSWSNKCTMFMLSYHQFSNGSKSGGTCQLWELSDAVDVPIWSTVCEMCSLQFCDISWGLNKQY